MKFPENPNVWVYCVSNRPALASRLVFSLITNMAPINNFLLVIDKEDEEAWMNEGGNFFGETYSILANHDLAYSRNLRLFILATEKSGLVAKKNLALQYILQEDGPGENTFAMNLDDDMLVDPNTIPYLLNGFYERPEYFALGPVIRQPDDCAFDWNEQMFDKRIGYVDEHNTWQWGGFRQGIRYPTGFEKFKILDADHLAGAYMHRMSKEYSRLSYDPLFDMGICFLHESDFVYEQKSGVVLRSVVHHNSYPVVKDNLSSKRNESESMVYEAVQIFARKHGLGKVQRIDWYNFRTVGEDL